MYEHTVLSRLFYNNYYYYNDVLLNFIIAEGSHNRIRSDACRSTVLP